MWGTALQRIHKSKVYQKHILCFQDTCLKKAADSVQHLLQI